MNHIDEAKNQDMATVERKKFKGMTRRELLKLSPLLALGAFAVPAWRDPLLKAGLGFSDWASARLFREVLCKYLRRG
jgi:hypothetical protein